jgi:hypothetical protein
MIEALLAAGKPNSPHQTNAAAELPSPGTLTTRNVSNITAQPIRWMWQDRIARGKLTIIAGNPGLGKSQITASIAAVVTTGGLWPVHRERCDVGDVVFLSAEDDPADTLRPRLEAAGADLSRVHVIDGVIAGYTGDGDRRERSFCLQEDTHALGRKLAELGNVAVVILDPITAYLGGTDSHKNAEVRALLTPLSELASRYNVAVIGVSHLTKAAGTQVLMRVTGSLAFVAAARAAYLVAPDPQDATKRLFVPMKNNVGPDTTGLSFRIESATISSPAGPLATSRVVWDSEPVTATADDVMNTGGSQRGHSVLDAARNWLKEILASGSMPAVEVFERAEGDGLAKITVKRASVGLKVQKQKSSRTGGWTWSLPPKGIKNSEEYQENVLSPFGDLDPLGASEQRLVEVEL